ncbi:Uncharacterised protein [BD1-7 clade bacterium]|uniref:Uncharacterized protein n=1 Tax=BD1-7 clade bacterium TaxID=2029982 RepID=A0A5S9PGP7_9GAMM|nr:Uncharacterised protein [BD1-7 clade bacterium]CAA0110323.1 Uncharacterised protein [BD1-7 clade bacterium]
MYQLTRSFIGAACLAASSLALAADSGLQTSEYDIDGGFLGSGGGTGSGTWGVSTSRNGDVTISINDSGNQRTTLTNTVVASNIVMTKRADTGIWSGTSTPRSCSGSGCNFVKLDVPVELYGILVELDANNVGTVTQYSDNSAAGVTATTQVIYTFTE